MTEAADLVVEVGNTFGPEVLDGLRLYNRLHGDARSPQEVETAWPRWFTENPFGGGMFAVARSGGRVVGFTCFIAARMRVGGRVLTGGKGEFFAVEPAFRKALVPGTETPVPLALLSGLYRRSREFGMEVLFAVPNPAASLVNLLAGAKAMKVEQAEFVTFFRPPRKRLHANPLRNAVLSAGAVGYTSVRRGVAGLGPRGAATVAPFERFQEIPLPAGGEVNLLVDDSPATLEHRFAGERHWRYRVTEPGRPAADFVFTRFPDDVRLAWWSRLDVSPAGISALLREAGNKAQQVGVSNLRVALPWGEVPLEWRLERAGFLRRRVQHAVFLYSQDPALMAARNVHTWRLTNAHMGYY